MNEKTLATLIIGGGPAGISILLAARRAGLLETLIQRGMKVLEQTPGLGAGELGTYVIRSDSFADSFISSPNDEGIPSLRHLMDYYPGSHLNNLRGSPVELTIAAEYLSEIGKELHHWDMVNNLGIFSTNITAMASHLDEQGSWTTICQNSDGTTQKFHSKSLILATGADQTLGPLYSIPVCGEPLLPRFADKTILSKHALALAGPSLLSSRLRDIRQPRIAIVGGSHSALSSVWVCLNKLEDVNTQNIAITVLHKNKLALTYSSPEAAHQDGYYDFGRKDICPKTGRVYPLAGFRSDSRELMRRIWGLGGLPIETRIKLLKLGRDSSQEARRVLEQADIIIAALGYRPRALPLFNAQGNPIALKSQLTYKAPLVDHDSRVLDSHNKPIRNVYCMGLSAGYPLAGRYGEPSFNGEANGIALWQSDIGGGILQQILKTG